MDGSSGNIPFIQKEEVGLQGKGKQSEQNFLLGIGDFQLKMSCTVLQF